MGGKGGPLAFLNKKGWHPGNQRNQERVWKREQEALAEKKQVEELRKQYEEARQKEEMEAIAVAAGVKKKQERLDWMYQGGMVAKQEAEKRQDAQMLGEKEIAIQAEEPTSKADEVAALPTFYTTDNAASANEMWSRLHGDPMFAIKQQELMARKNLVANPVQMDAIRKAVAKKKEAKEERKAAKREAKAARKAAKKSKKDKKRKHEPSSSESDSSNEEREKKRARGDHDVHQDLHGRHRADGHDIDHRPTNGHQSRDEGPRPSQRSSHREDERPHRDAERGRERDHRRSDVDAKSERHRDSSHDRRDERTNGHSRYENDGRSRKHERDPHLRRAEVTTHHDSASAQGRDLVYGLNKANGQDHEDRESRRRETERRLEEAAQKKAAEEKEKAAQRYQRKEHKTGRLTEDERQQRLAEMTGNAAVHEEARWARLQAARKRDDADNAVEAALKEKAAAAHAAPGRHHQDTAKFLSKATKEIYNADDASAADRISRRKFYNDRDEGGGAFRR